MLKFVEDENGHIVGAVQVIDDEDGEVDNGMSIDKAIPKIQFVRNALNDGMEIAKAYDMAIETMRKYQQIEQIINYRYTKSVSETLDEIVKVVEDENVDL